MDVHDLLDEIEIPGITESAVPKKAPGVERQLVFPRRKGANRLSALNVEPEDHDLLGAQNRPKRSVGQCRVPHFAPAISGPISGTALRRGGVQDPATRGSIHWGTGFPLVSGPANGVTISPMR
jgi:hypothetical protein